MQLLVHRPVAAGTASQMLFGGGVPQDIRLLATVVAKNAVGSSWRKTLGTREWARIPAEEKAQVRANVLGLLLNEPSRRVAIQLALLIANVARFDFPTPW